MGSAFSNRSTLLYRRLFLVAISTNVFLLYLLNKTSTYSEQPATGGNQARTKSLYVPPLPFSVQKQAANHVSLMAVANRTDGIHEAGRNRVKDMMRHAWSSYKKYAWGYDELKPLSKTGHNWTKYSYLFTPIDALDTLFIMDLKEEYAECKNLVLDKLDFNQEPDHTVHNINHFETTIRVLGGLLSAYDLDPDQRFLDKAVDLGDRLLGAFDNPSGLPSMWVNLATGKRDSGNAILASVGTLQLEFQYLSDVSGNPVYQKKALAVLDTLKKMNVGGIPGLYPKYLDASTGKFTSKAYGIGADADSFYEYLLKLSISISSEKYKDMYLESVHAIMANLLQQEGETTYFGEKSGNQLTESFHHL
ncbi:Mannosyl-oligosaccharide 1,2-alpha-mannosidase IA, partial [Kappamyces sp. JEL0680]